MSTTENSKIDWNAVRERLKEDEASLHALLEPNEQQVKNILDARAQALRRKQQDASSTAIDVKCLIVKTGGERMALELVHISGVEEIKKLVAVPGGGSQVLGIANVSGSLQAVISPLTLMRNAEASQIQHPRWGIVLRHPQLQVMLGVDELLQISTVQKSAVDETGIFMIDEQMTVFLELEAILNDLEEKRRHRTDITSHD